MKEKYLPREISKKLKKFTLYINLVREMRKHKEPLWELDLEEETQENTNEPEVY